MTASSNNTIDLCQEDGRNIEKFMSSIRLNDKTD
jgi:hypothetical protein